MTLIRDEDDSDESASGLDETQADMLHRILSTALHKLINQEFHYALFVVMRGDGDDELASIDTLTSMPKEALHEILRDWLKRKTH